MATEVKRNHFCIKGANGRVCSGCGGAFEIPFIVSQDPPPFIKAKTGENGLRRVYVYASDETKDTDNEIVARSLLEKSVEYFLKNGHYDWNHQSFNPNSESPAKYILGYPEEVVFTKGNACYVRGVLYSGTKLADDVWSLLNADPPGRLRVSVGGVIKKAVSVRDKKGRPVKKAVEGLWTHLAFAVGPVHQNTNVSLVPFGAFVKSIYNATLDKALEAGSGTDVATLTGGRALTMEQFARKVANTGFGGDDPLKLGPNMVCEHTDDKGRPRQGLKPKQALQHSLKCLHLDGEPAFKQGFNFWRLSR